MIRSIALLLFSSAFLVGLCSAALSAGSDYSKALQQKKQIEQMTGVKDAAPEPAQGPPASNTLHLDAPMRKAGWWEFAAVTQSGTAIGKQNLCIGEASEKVYSAFDQITGEAMTGLARSGTSNRPRMAGTSRRRAVRATCRAWAISPCDVATQYEVHQTVTSAGTTTAGTIQAALKGPCPEGRKEGDLVDESGDLLVNMIAP
jgi:hypothetical protein